MADSEQRAGALGVAGRREDLAAYQSRVGAGPGDALGVEPPGLAWRSCRSGLGLSESFTAVRAPRARCSLPQFDADDLEA